MRFTIYRKEKRKLKKKSHAQLEREARKQAKLKRMSENVQVVKTQVQLKKHIPVKEQAVIRPVCMTDIQFDAERKQYFLHYVALDAFGDAIPYSVYQYTYDEIYQAFIEASSKQMKYSY